MQFLRKGNPNATNILEILAQHAILVQQDQILLARQSKERTIVYALKLEVQQDRKVLVSYVIMDGVVARESYVQTHQLFYGTTLPPVVQLPSAMLKR